MSSELDILAIITPSKGKEAEVKDLLRNLVKDVKANEKEISKYQFFEENGENGYVIYVEEKYANQAALDSHLKTNYFQALGKQIGDKGLLAKPLEIKTINPIFGFSR